MGVFLYIRKDDKGILLNLLIIKISCFNEAMQTQAINGDFLLMVVRIRYNNRVAVR